MKRWAKPLIFFGILIVIFILIRFTKIGAILTFENLMHSREAVKNFVSFHYLISVLIFIAIYIIVTSFSIPGALILTLSGGFLFSTVPGALFVNVGATIGACNAFLASRYFLGDFVQEKYADKLSGFNSEIKSNGAGYLLTLRFIPVFPFFLINLLAGLTKVRFFTFFWTTSAGILPASLVYTYTGSNLAELKSVSGIFSWKILSVLILLGVFSILPGFLKKIFRKNNLRSN